MRLLPIAEFTYNNTKNANTGYTLFKLNYGFYPQVLFKKDNNSCFRSRLVNKLSDKLRELIEICYQNLFYVQELQKKVHNKEVKSHSYTLSKKVWLNSKYIKTKRINKLGNKFFGSFQVFYTIRKQVYKLELPTK